MMTDNDHGVPYHGVIPFSTEPETLCDGIVRIRVPFEDIYTSVYVLTEGDRCAVLDSADSERDVETYLFPYLAERGLTPQFLICSHFHGDHAGGASAVLARYPACRAVGFAAESPFPAERWVCAADGTVFLDRFAVINLPGHTPDSLAVFDLRASLLLTCDCLQQCGVGRYGSGITDADAYVRTVEKVRTLGVQTVVAAHNFVPLGDRADGMEAVDAYLDMCIDTLLTIKMFIDTHDGDAEMCNDKHSTDAKIAKMFNGTHPYHPELDAGKIAAIRQLHLL